MYAALSMREMAFDACPTGVSSIDRMGKVKIQSYQEASGAAQRSADPMETIKDIQEILGKQREMDAFREDARRLAEANGQSTDRRMLGAARIVKIPASAAPKPVQLADPQPTTAHKRHRHKRH